MDASYCPITVYYTLNGTVPQTSELSNGIFQLYKEKHLSNDKDKKFANRQKRNNI